jgi:hypothetical protein
MEAMAGKGWNDVRPQTLTREGRSEASPCSPTMSLTHCILTAFLLLWSGYGPVGRGQDPPIRGRVVHNRCRNRGDNRACQAH